jgi:death on curing protein
MIRRLSVNEVQQIAFELAKQMMEWDEPIPPFETRFSGKLESCLAAPFQTFDRKSLYPSFEEKAAMLFYLMIKNHPFANGNKRLAVTTLLCFLHANGKWLRAGHEPLYELALMVAKSDPHYKDEFVTIIRKFLKRYLVKGSD